MSVVDGSVFCYELQGVYVNVCLCLLLSVPLHLQGVCVYVYVYVCVYVCVYVLLIRDMYEFICTLIRVCLCVYISF